MSEDLITDDPGLLGHALGISTRGGRKRGWAEGEVGPGCGHNKGSTSPVEAGAQWPFRVVLSWDKGRAWTLYLHISLCLDGGSPQRGVRSLLSQLFPAQGNPMGRASSRLSGGIPNSWGLFFSPKRESGPPSPAQHPLHFTLPAHLVSKSVPNFKIFRYTVRWSLRPLETQCPGPPSCPHSGDLVTTNLNLRVWARWPRCQELRAEPGQQHVPVLQPSLQCTWGRQHHCV